MFKRILVPTDGSDITAKAAQTAFGLAKLHGAQLYAISVKEPFPYSAISEMQPVPPQEFYDAQERIAAARVKARDRCRGCGRRDLRGPHGRGPACLGSDPRPRQGTAVRPDRDGVARPPRRGRHAARQRDFTRTHAQHGTGPGRQITALHGPPGGWRGQRRNRRATRAEAGAPWWPVAAEAARPSSVRFRRPPPVHARTSAGRPCRRDRHRCHVRTSTQ